MYIFEFVRKKIAEIERSPQRNVRLAHLYKGVFAKPGDLSIYKDTQRGCPDEWVDRKDASDPTPQEWAIHIAVTLWATHSARGPYSMNENEGLSIGGALGRLHAHQISSSMNIHAGDMTYARRGAVFSSRDPEIIVHTLHKSIKLFKTANIKLDYPRLAAELEKIFDYDTDEDEIHSIRRIWGLDFETRGYTE
jgi:CRISPR type I-E-associated protein CasB/Cse2